jgi:hypothetical protein
MGCNTIYTPPTPIWAALLFILIGVVMLLAGSFFVIAGILRGVKDPIGSVFFGGVVAVGVLAVIHGVRVLLSPGNV